MYVFWHRLQFFIKIGFQSVTFSSLEEHDRIIAYTSQLAHITSNAYIKSPTAQMHMGFSAGSYRDLTRVAKLGERKATIGCASVYASEIADYLRLQGFAVRLDPINGRNSNLTVTW